MYFICLLSGSSNNHNSFLAFVHRYDSVLPWDDDVDLAMDYNDIASVNDSIMALVRVYVRMYFFGFAQCVLNLATSQ